MRFERSCLAPAKPKTGWQGNCNISSLGKGINNLLPTPAHVVEKRVTASFSEQVMAELSPQNSAGGLRFWLRGWPSFLTVLLMLIVTLEFMMARSGMGDPDIWWHLRNADY